MFGCEARLSTAEVPREGKILLLSRDPARRAAAAQRLGRSACAAAYGWLRQALWDPEESVQLRVVEAVGELAAHQALGELAALFAWSGPRVRRAVVRAAGRIAPGPSQGGILSLAAGDPDHEVRSLAQRAARLPAASARPA
jgi:hypothetical protein